MGVRVCVPYRIDTQSRRVDIAGNDPTIQSSGHIIRYAQAQYIAYTRFHT